MLIFLDYNLLDKNSAKGVVVMQLHFLRCTVAQRVASDIYAVITGFYVELFPYIQVHTIDRPH